MLHKCYKKIMLLLQSGFDRAVRIGKMRRADLIVNFQLCKIML